MAKNDTESINELIELLAKVLNHPLLPSHLYNRMVDELQQLGNDYQVDYVCDVTLMRVWMPKMIASENATPRKRRR